ncbi:DUF421 domain-containing protein [Gracilibacillus sp. S3-1-1]|uniref:DUF421 domain-containing protein n=1 Tax=Gracilibacillus pellucidus TaxID=3095368 RepID=A0ACC6M1T7_9BACI|nr:DUF421 domain-containing protein [Gracilibacillus sp. S3-1-1]MDX8044843.1 DUF421 domain-containing protein [Gracilibacillus sp. S3-1-1]
MDFDWIWKSILIISVGTFLLRVAGRKSISQMTLAQTVLMIAIGSLLIQPVAGENIWVTFGVCMVLIITLIVIEYIQLKSDKAEMIISGKSNVLIKDGKIIEKNLKRYRLSVDLLEMLLRQKNVMQISDVEWATLEPNGQLGYALKPEAQPMTKADLQQVINQLEQIRTSINPVPVKTNYNNQPSSNKENIFQEVADKKHQTPPPDHLR